MEVAEESEALGRRLVAISFTGPPLLERYERALDLPFAFYADPDRRAYAALGFERATVARVWLDPRVWARYAGLLARGGRLRPPQDDTLQLGGDVLLGGDGRIEWVHRSSGPEDRPSVATILAAAARRPSLGSSS